MASSLLIPVLSNGGADVQPIRVLGIEISVIILLAGIWSKLTGAGENFQPGKRIRHMTERTLDLPSIVWVLIGFVLVYLLMFISPVFLNANLQMNYITGYLPNLNPIGNDLIVMVEQIKGWVATGQSPYAVQFYPPLTYIIFSPLLLIEDYHALYRFFILFGLVNYCLLSFLLPLKIVEKRNIPLILLFFITGLLSYGFQFELERGQYNIFAFLLCMSSIHIFHHRRKHRLIAYLLFSLSIHLKLYPAIFIFMFVDDWRDWKNVILRFAGIGAFNFLLLFAMGYQTFTDFIRSVFIQIANPGWIGITNHSISSFVSMIKRDAFGLVDFITLRELRHNAELIEALLLLVFFILFVSAVVIFHLRRKPGMDVYLLLACTIGAMILPISYDYTLTILGTPLALFLCGIEETRNPRHKFVSILLTLGISASYASLLIPSIYRPYVLSNAFPALFFILILLTILNVIRYINSKAPAAELASE
jgi:hypothetical protein